MWFRALSFVIAGALLIKAAIALTIPRQFYAARHRQYSSASLPLALMVPSAVVLSVTSIAWYATFFHYRPWGWVITACLTLLCGLSLHNLSRWRRHREVMSRIVADPRVWLVDCLLLVLGGGFAALGLLVF